MVIREKGVQPDHRKSRCAELLLEPWMFLDTWPLLSWNFGTLTPTGCLFPAANLFESAATAMLIVEVVVNFFAARFAS